MKIDVNILEEEKACAEVFNWFQKEFGENAEIEIETVIKTLETQKNTKGWVFWLFETFKLSGLAKKWHENGQLLKKGNYLDGKRHGQYKSWHENGQLWEKCNFLNGKLHGEYKSWYNNGQLREKCNYLDGKLHGKCLAWYQDGLIRK